MNGPWVDRPDGGLIPSWIDPPPPRVDPPVGRSAHPRINATTNQLAPALITLRTTRFGLLAARELIKGFISSDAKRGAIRERSIL